MKKNQSLNHKLYILNENFDEALLFNEILNQIAFEIFTTPTYLFLY